MLDHDQQRDNAEEQYLGQFCPDCNDSPCQLSKDIHLIRPYSGIHKLWDTVLIMVDRLRMHIQPVKDN